MDEVLYILMRNDLPSMNAGKAMAQASHASNQLVKEFGDKSAVADWAMQTKGGFGTVLVLSTNEKEMFDAVSLARAKGYPAAAVVDPSYPYRADKELAGLIPVSADTVPRVINGDKVTLWRREVTCGFVLGRKEDLANIVGQFPLHP